MTNQQIQIELADAAITHVLRRIHESPEIGYYMGVCTESFERLSVAYGALHDQKPEDVREIFLPIFAKDPTKEARERIVQLEDAHESILLSSGNAVYDDPPVFGPQSLTAEDFVDQVKLLLGEHHNDSEACVQAIAALFDINEVPYPILARR